jgi:hypothetical protein
MGNLETKIALLKVEVSVLKKQRELILKEITGKQVWKPYMVVKLYDETLIEAIFESISEIKNNE